MVKRSVVNVRCGVNMKTSIYIKNGGSIDTTDWPPTADQEVQQIQQAAKNIKMTNKRGKFSENELVDLLRLLAEGASERKIINYFRRHHKRVISSHTIANYRRSYAHRIAEISRDVDALAIELGLTRRAVRLKKLQELAEAIEGIIFNSDGELASENAKMIEKYLNTLEQIGQETGDLATHAVADINFINMSNDELKQLIANKITAYPDLAKQLAERAGVRPSYPIEKELDSKNERSVD